MKSLVRALGGVLRVCDALPRRSLRCFSRRQPLVIETSEMGVGRSFEEIGLPSETPRHDALTTRNLESAFQRVQALTGASGMQQTLQSRDQPLSTKYLYLFVQLSQKYDRSLFLSVLDAMKRDVPMTSKLYEDILKISKRVRDPSLVPILVDDQTKSLRSAPSLESLELLCLSFRGRLGPAIELYNRMHPGKLHIEGYPPPSSLIYTCLFNSFTPENVSFYFVRSLMEECSRTAVFPSATSLSHYFSVLAKSVITHGELINLLQIFQFSRLNKLRLSAYCYAKFIRLCGRNKLAPLGLSLFDYLLESDYEMTPDLYGSVLCCFLDNSALITQYFRSIKERHVPLSIHMFNYLLEAHAREGSIAKCLSLLEDVQASGMEPNVQSHIHVVHCFLSAGQYDKGYEYVDLLLSQLNSGLSAPPTLLYAALELCAAQVNHEKAQYYLECFSSDSFVLKGKPINSLLSSSIQNGNSDRIQFYLSHLRLRHGFLSVDTALLLLQRSLESQSCEEGLMLAKFLLENQLLLRVDSDLLSVISGLQSLYHQRHGEHFSLPDVPASKRSGRSSSRPHKNRQSAFNPEDNLEKYLLRTSVDRREETGGEEGREGAASEEEEMER